MLEQKGQDFKETSIADELMRRWSSSPAKEVRRPMTLRVDKDLFFKLKALQAVFPVKISLDSLCCWLLSNGLIEVEKALKVSNDA